MAISGIETLMQLGLLGEALGSNFSKQEGLPKTLKNVVVVLGNTLEKTKCFPFESPTMV